MKKPSGNTTVGEYIAIGVIIAILSGLSIKCLGYFRRISKIKRNKKKSREENKNYFLYMCTIIYELSRLIVYPIYFLRYLLIYNLTRKKIEEGKIQPPSGFFNNKDLKQNPELKKIFNMINSGKIFKTNEITFWLKMLELKEDNFEVYKMLKAETNNTIYHIREQEKLCKLKRISLEQKKKKISSSENYLLIDDSELMKQELELVRKESVVKVLKETLDKRGVSLETKYEKP